MVCGKMQKLRKKFFISMPRVGVGDGLHSMSKVGEMVAMTSESRSQPLDKVVYAITVEDIVPIVEAEEGRG